MKKWTTKNNLQVHQVLNGRSNSFLVSQADRHILIDTGPKNAWNTLNKNIAKLIPDNGSLQFLILTHIHFDHVENTARINEKYNAKIITNQYETEYLKKGLNAPIKGSLSPTKLITNLLESQFGSLKKFMPAECTIEVNNDYSLNDFGFNIIIIPTPGHTHGSISVIVDNEIAIVGDAMFGVFPWSVFPPFAINPKILVQSWGRLLNTECSFFLPGHGTGNSRKLVQKEYDKYIQKLQ